MATANTAEKPEVEETPITPIEEAFINGSNAGLGEDQIKIAMIQAGSTFKSVSRDYAAFLVKHGIIDSKEAKESKINSIIPNFDVTTEEGFYSAVNAIMAEVRGVDEKSAAGSIRWYCRKHEQPHWIKPKAEGAGRLGFARLFFNALVANPLMTSDEVILFIDLHGTENTKRATSHYQNIRKLANAIAGAHENAEEMDEEEDEDE